MNNRRDSSKYFMKTLDYRPVPVYDSCVLFRSIHPLWRDRGDRVFLTLNYKSRKPLCDQLCDGVIRLAACGGLEPGEQLPSVRSLAQELGINPNTVQKAYRILESQGVLETVPGKGSFLASENNAQEQLRLRTKKTLGVALQEALDRGLTVEEVADYCATYLQKKKEEDAL